PVSEADRRKFEDDYLRQAKEREKREADRAKNGNKPTSADIPQTDAAVQAASPTDVAVLVPQGGKPQFISPAYFLRFKFEQGKYARVGREPFDGRQVL